LRGAKRRSNPSYSENKGGLLRCARNGGGVVICSTRDSQ
jgi:hypothetical protein